jgi:hypothetical protein
MGSMDSASSMEKAARYFAGEWYLVHRDDWPKESSSDFSFVAHNL